MDQEVETEIAELRAQFMRVIQGLNTQMEASITYGAAIRVLLAMVYALAGANDDRERMRSGFLQGRELFAKLLPDVPEQQLLNDQVLALIEVFEKETGHRLH